MDKGNTGNSSKTYNLRHSVPKKIPIVFYNGSKYYYFIIKELAEEFKYQFICFRKKLKNT